MDSRAKLERRKLSAITEEDRAHMQRFPARKKAAVVREIQMHVPVEEKRVEGNAACVRTLLHLRRSGLRLIDLQPQETAFTTLWYGKGRSGGVGWDRGEIVAALVWELFGYERATLRVWHF